MLLHRLAKFLNQSSRPEPGKDRFAKALLFFSLGVLGVLLLFPIFKAFTTGELAWHGTSTRHWIYLVANLGLSFWLLHLWNRSPIKQEFCYLAIYALVQSIYQVQYLTSREDLFFGGDLTSLKGVLASYEACFGMFFGLSFARNRREIFQIGVPLFLTLPWLAIISINTFRFPNFFDSAAFEAMIPMFYLVGALSCALQAHFLGSLDLQGNPNLRVRRKRLLQVFGLLIVTLLLHAGHTVGHSIPWFERIVYQAAHLGLVFTLSRIVVREYTENVRFMTEETKQAA